MQEKKKKKKKIFPNFEIQINLHSSKHSGVLREAHQHALPVFVMKQTFTSAERTDVRAGSFQTKQQKQPDTIIHCCAWGEPKVEM